MSLEEKVYDKAARRALNTIMIYDSVPSNYRGILVEDEGSRKSYMLATTDPLHPAIVPGFTLVEGGVTYYIVYEDVPIEYIDVTIAPTVNGTVLVNGQNGPTVTVQKGSNVTITAVPDSGYEVDVAKLNSVVITLPHLFVATDPSGYTVTVSFKVGTGPLADTFALAGYVTSPSQFGAYAATTDSFTTYSQGEFSTNAIANSIKHLNGKWWLVGNGSRIESSNDPISWTPATHNIVASFNDIDYDSVSGLYVVCGSGGKVVYSNDGINWTDNTIGTTFQMRSIIHIKDEDLWVTCGNTGYVATSADGINWDFRRVITTSGATLGSLMYQDGRLFMVNTAANTVYISDNLGVNWTAKTLQTGTFKAVAGDDNGTVIAVGLQGRGSMSSDNGDTWVNANLPSNYDMYSAAWDGTQFCVVGLQNTIAFTTDGLNYTTKVSTTGRWNKVAVKKV